MCTCKREGERTGETEGEEEMKERGSTWMRDRKRIMDGWIVCVYICVCVCVCVCVFRGGRVNEIFLIARLKVAGCWFNGLMTLMGHCVPFRYCCG